MAPTEAPWGVGKPPFIIAEIGLTHEGSLGNALAFIDACAAVGASAVKFQCHDGDPNDKFRHGYHWPQDYSRQDYWDRTRFGWPEWKLLAQHAHNCRICIGCTPFSQEAVTTVAQFSDFVKVSRQNYDNEIHRAAKETSLPVLHTGPGGLSLNSYRHCDISTALGSSTAHIGISDHSGSIKRAKDAIEAGAQVAELHVCWDRRQFGPDVAYSVTIDELGELVKAVR